MLRGSAWRSTLVAWLASEQSSGIATRPSLPHPHMHARKHNTVTVLPTSFSLDLDTPAAGQATVQYILLDMRTIGSLLLAMRVTVSSHALVWLSGSKLNDLTIDTLQ